MQSLRTLARLGARTARFSTPALPRTYATRTLAASTWRAVPKTHIAAAFSTSARTRRSDTDNELLAKIDSELALERQLNEYDEVPSSVKEYLDSTPFKLEDKPGQELVELVRNYGNETIRVQFSISDINALTEDALDTSEDSALYDEDIGDVTNTQSGGAQPKGSPEHAAVSGGVDTDYEPPSDEPSFPARMTITIEKPDAGALQIEAMSQDGMIIIDNVYFHNSGKLANENTAEADWQRRGVYAGPPFGNLDEDLQVLLERYLEDRGVNTTMALFIPDYIDYKEQREYLRWLENVKKFVAA